jgi:hypothetical protein
MMMVKEGKISIDEAMRRITSGDRLSAVVEPSTIVVPPRPTIVCCLSATDGVLILQKKASEATPPPRPSTRPVSVLEATRLCVHCNVL